MSAEIQFGEVEHAGVRTEVRPDRNRHYAVATCGRPDEDDLPIFVDLDAMLEMEEHADSDTSVELGGVMLGGQYEDNRGRPFVVVTDCLRAAHYEATKGSFKFTHDTWQEITRQRDEFPEELQMVGWYHTHPGWGVFLSGMDTFICENFFNRPLDLALVIDPCQQDRGFFQWSMQPTAQTIRTGGFYLVASRFREEELGWYAAYLGGESAMPRDVDRGFPPQRMPAPVVNISEGRPGWLGVAVVGMLVVQVFLTMLVAWRLMVPAGAAGGSAPSATQLEDLTGRVETLVKQQQAAGRLAAERAVLDRVLGEIEVAPGGLVTALDEQQQENTRLRAALTGYGALERDHEDLQESLKDLKADRDLLKKDLKQLNDRFAELDRSRKQSIRERDAEIASLSRKVRRLESGGDSDAEDGEEAGPWWLSLTGLTVIIGSVLLVVAGVGWSISVARKKRQLADEEGEPTDEQQEEDFEDDNPGDRFVGPQDTVM
jgi:proteasome lid subunit RPN8/RPN11